jgi:diguanylate cyclase (GGDEF)-like protein
VFSTVAVGIFFQHLMPTLFFVFPPMVLVTSIAGLEGAMVSSLLLTAIGWIATVHGHGPICFMQGMSNDDQLLLLQIFLCTFLASALPIGALADARRAANLKLHRLTLEDPLTGLGNRRSFDAVLDQDLRTSQETGRPLSVLMLDVDHFKLLNDTYGHAEGDRVLRELGDLLRRTVRSGDRVCRHGGEEFAIMLPETTVEQALCLAERICHVVRQHAWTVCGVTVSVGVAASTQGTSNSISLAAEADRALYAAKRAGRDQALLSNAIAS